jgi:hypothetical protein
MDKPLLSAPANQEMAIQRAAAAIGHMKADGRLGRNHLLGAAGDAMNALMVAAGHNLRLILNWLRLFVGTRPLSPSTVCPIVCRFPTSV